MSLSQKQVNEIKSNMTDLESRRRGAEQAAPPRAAKPAQSAAPKDEGNEDAAWARHNLRGDQTGLYLDLANALRILEHHPDFKGRFKFNDMINKVVDRGAVMVEWKISAITAEIQERFLPMLPSELVNNALVIAANKGDAKG